MDPGTTPQRPLSNRDNETKGISSKTETRTDEISSATIDAEEPLEEKKAQVKRQTLVEARPKLEQLVENFGQNTYQSSNCTIKSVFEHPREKINACKKKFTKECKEVVSEELTLHMKSLELNMKK